MTKKNDPKAAADRRALLRRFDVHGDRVLSTEDVYRGIARTYPEFDSMLSVTLAFHAADRTKNGLLQPTEFRLLLKYLLLYDDAWELFKLMDVNADGRLSLDELRAGQNLFDADVESAFHSMRTDKSDFVHLDEFATWLADHRQMGDAVVEDTRSASAAAPLLLDRLPCRGPTRNCGAYSRELRALCAGGQ